MLKEERVACSENDLFNSFNEQLSFLKKSATAYDDGDVTEAKRLSISLRILLHNTPRSKSLLSSIGLQETTPFLDTASKIIPNNLMPYSGLVVINYVSNGRTQTAKFKPLLDQFNKLPGRGRFVLFDAWWNSIVLIDSHKNEFTRKKLVLELADTDGGAHIDPKISKSFYQLTRQHSMNWQLSNGKTAQPLTDIHLASIRQIAYEVSISFSQHKITA